VFVRVAPVQDAPLASDGRPATVVIIGGLSKDSDPGLATIVASVGTAVHDRPAERTDRL
jgi:cytochrome c biogenesis protein